jgi:hypothetical protein
MKLRTAFLPISVFALLVSTVAAAPVDISASASFVGGLSGNWSFTYNTGAPDLYLQRITIDLSPTDLLFDTAPGNFGSLASQNVGNFGGTDTITGLSSVSPTGSGLDGGSFVSFSFTNFLPGMVFQFSADVDHPNPTLLTLLNCSGLTGAARIACNLTNAGRTATNNARLLSAEMVGPNAMAGAIVSFEFGGTGYTTRTVSGTFGSVTLRDVIERLLQGDGGNPFASDADVQTPEPATLALFGVGLGAVMLLRSLRG